MMIASVERPPVDWFAISPELSLLAAAGICLLAAVLVPAGARRATAALVGAGGYVAAFVFAVLLYDRSPVGESIIGGAIRRDRFGALAALIIAGVGFVAVWISYAEPMK